MMRKLFLNKYRCFSIWVICFLFSVDILSAQDSICCPGYIITFNDGYCFSKIAGEKHIKRGNKLNLRLVGLWADKGKMALGGGVMYSHSRIDIKHKTIQTSNPLLDRVSANYVAPQVSGIYQPNGYILLGMNAGIGYFRCKGEEEYNEKKNTLYSNGLAFNVAANFSSLVTKYIGLSLEVGYMEALFSKVHRKDSTQKDFTSKRSNMVTRSIDTMFGIFFYF